MKNRFPILVATVCAGLVASSPDLLASPILYSYDDTAAGSFAGSGVFRIDIGVPLGHYEASDVGGGGATFGSWGSVSFLATPGVFGSLTISNLALASLTISLPGIGGGAIQAGSSASDEWDNFLVQAGRIGIRITELTAVPDESSTLGVLGAGLAGILAYRRGLAERATRR